MSSTQRIFTNLEEGRSFLNQFRSKPGQQVKITVHETSKPTNNDSWKNALNNVFGMWQDRTDLDEVFNEFRADFDSRFDTNPS